MAEWCGHRGRSIGNHLAPSFSPLSDAVGNVGEFGEYPDGHDLVYWLVGCVGAQAGELEFRQGDVKFIAMIAKGKNETNQNLACYCYCCQCRADSHRWSDILAAIYRPLGNT